MEANDTLQAYSGIDIFDVIDIASMSDEVVKIEETQTQLSDCNYVIVVNYMLCDDYKPVLNNLTYILEILNMTSNVDIIIDEPKFYHKGVSEYRCMIDRDIEKYKQSGYEMMINIGISGTLKPANALKLISKLCTIPMSKLYDYFKNSNGVEYAHTEIAEGLSNAPATATANNKTPYEDTYVPVYRLSSTFKLLSLNAVDFCINVYTGDAFGKIENGSASSSTSSASASASSIDYLTMGPFLANIRDYNIDEMLKDLFSVLCGSLESIYSLYEDYPFYIMSDFLKTKWRCSDLFCEIGTNIVDFSKYKYENNNGIMFVMPENHFIGNCTLNQMNLKKEECRVFIFNGNIYFLCKRPFVFADKEKYICWFLNLEKMEDSEINDYLEIKNAEAYRDMAAKLYGPDNRKMASKLYSASDNRKAVVKLYI